MQERLNPFQLICCVPKAWALKNLGSKTRHLAGSCHGSRESELAASHEVPQESFSRVSLRIASRSVKAAGLGLLSHTGRLLQRHLEVLGAISPGGKIEYQKTLSFNLV